MLTKKELRNRVKELLLSYPIEKRDKETDLVTKIICNYPKYQSARSISIFASLNHEIQTKNIIKHALESGKRVFLPKVISSTEMVMLQIYNMEDYNSLKPSKWKIPEPDFKCELRNMMREEALEDADIDLMLLPGIAFDKNHNRIGYGAGYYDRYVEKLQEMKKVKDSEPCTLVGIGLSLQLVDNIPADNHDKTLDNVVFPEGIF